MKIPIFPTPTLPSLQERIYTAIEYWTCWHTLSRLTSEKLYRTGLASVFLVPAFASLCMTLHWQGFFPRRVLWLFFSGIAVIAANTMYALCCPVIVKEQLHRQRYESYRPWPLSHLRDELLAAFALELSRIEYTEKDLGWLKIRSDQHCQTIIGMMESGYPCPVIGYSASSVYKIEDLLLRAATASGVALYVKYPQDKDYRLSTPFDCWLPGNSHELVEFEFSLHRSSDMRIGPGGDFFLGFGREDGFFLEWRKAGCDLPHPWARNPLDRAAMGAYAIVNPKNATVLRETLAEWATLSRTPWRLITFVLFGISLLLLGVFLYCQIAVVIRMMRL